MKKNYTFLFLLAGTISSLAFVNSKASSIEKAELTKTHTLNSAGAPTGKTGAPGETNCTDCHTGTVQSGDVNALVITDANGIVTDYEPGTTYNVAVTFTTAAARNGFEVVALRNSNNSQAGTMIAGTGNQVVNGSAGKKYVTHTTAGNALSAWTFQWTAPATNVGQVKFYLATNQTNANGQSTGDVIRLSQHSITSTSTVGIKENKTVGLQVGFAASTGQLVIDLDALSSGSAFVNLVDINGKSVFTEQLGTVSVGENQLKVRIPESIPAGIYIAHVGVNNTFASQKIAIQR